MTSRPGELPRALALIGIGASGGRALHPRMRDAHVAPILDLSLMRVPTFRLSVIAGSLTRITQGAQPFLLPLMLQLGFGMSAATSGSITIAGAIGSLGMKWLAPGRLRRFGFRNSLIVNGLIATAGYAVCGPFRPAWPVAAIFGVLTACGFFMSFQFTAYNTIAYDEIPPERMSSATSFYATFQQLMLSLGICVGAGALHVGMLATHATIAGSPRLHPGLPGGDGNLRLGDDLEPAVRSRRRGSAGRPGACDADRKGGLGGPPAREFGFPHRIREVGEVCGRSTGSSPASRLPR